MNEHHNPQERHQSHAFGRQIFENSVSYITTRRWSHGVCAVSTLRQRGLAFDVWRVAPVPIEEPDFKLTFIGVPLKLKICVPDGHRTLCPLTLSRPTSIRSCWVIAGLETGQQPGWRWLRCRMEARSSASQRNCRKIEQKHVNERDTESETNLSEDESAKETFRMLVVFVCAAMTFVGCQGIDVLLVVAMQLRRCSDWL